MRNKTLILSVTKNQRDEFSIMRDGGMLKNFEAGTMDTQMILQYAINLGQHVNKLEKRPVKVVDNFSIETACCPDCGSLNVSTKAWQNLKTGSVESISNDDDDNHCEDCDKHVELDNMVIDPKVGILIAKYK